jgi:hypothetical protein
MPTVTVYFGGICTFFSPDAHAELDGFWRVVLVNAANGRVVAGRPIPPHHAEVQIGDNVLLPAHGQHMRLTSHGSACPAPEEFARSCPDLTTLLQEQGRLLSSPSRKVVFDGDPNEAALYFDFDGGMLEAGTNDLGAVVSRLVLRGDVVLDTLPFGGGGEPVRMVFQEDTTILVSNDDTIEDTSEFDFYLHYLTAESVPSDPPIPAEPHRRRLPVLPHLPHWFGSIGAGCSNSTYP